jgi:hypothetical protein
MLAILLAEAHGCYAGLLRELLRLHGVGRQPEINAHDPASATTSETCNMRDHSLQVLQRYVRGDPDVDRAA